VDLPCFSKGRERLRQSTTHPPSSSPRPLSYLASRTTSSIAFLLHCCIAGHSSLRLRPLQAPFELSTSGASSLRAFLTCRKMDCCSASRFSLLYSPPTTPTTPSTHSPPRLRQCRPILPLLQPSRRDMETTSTSRTTSTATARSSRPSKKRCSVPNSPIFLLTTVERSRSKCASLRPVSTLLLTGTMY
jgi:hypothetical protein